MNNLHAKYRVGYWMADKKLEKMQFLEKFTPICKSLSIEIVKINIEIDFIDQGPFNIIIHKFTDHILNANNGDEESKYVLDRLQKYRFKFPNTVIIDSIEHLKRILNRYNQYDAITECIQDKIDFFIPSFIELECNNIEMNKKLIKLNHITYPFVCKPLCAHGSSSHDMKIIFSEDRLADIEAPCIAMSFINHNARLYKIFVVGRQYRIVERPSVKNLYAGPLKTISFDSQDVSKPHASTELNGGHERNNHGNNFVLDESKIANIVELIRCKFRMYLCGIDIFIDEVTGKYAIIDINNFPGYEGVNDFYEMLGQLFTELLSERTNIDRSLKNNILASSSSFLID